MWARHRGGAEVVTAIAVACPRVWCGRGTFDPIGVSALQGIETSLLANTKFLQTFERELRPVLHRVVHIVPTVGGVLYNRD